MLRFLALFWAFSLPGTLLADCPDDSAESAGVATLDLRTGRFRPLEPYSEGALDRAYSATLRFGLRTYFFNRCRAYFPDTRASFDGCYAGADALASGLQCRGFWDHTCFEQDI